MTLQAVADSRKRSPAFSPGAPLPRVPVRDDAGRPTELLAEVEGRSAALLCLARPHSPAARQAARRFSGLELPVPQLARIVLLPSTTRGTDAAELASLGLKVYVALDDAALPADERLLTWAAIDAAGRVLAGGELRPNQVTHLAARVRAAFASPESAPGTPLSRTAPVLIVAEVLTPELCARLVEYFEHSDSHPSGVLDLSGPKPEWRPDPAIKRRRDLMLEDPALIREIEQCVAARVLPEIRRCFQYAVTHHEPFKLVCYEEGSGYFRPHRDNETSDTHYRRFAMTINLNTGDYEGGALQFPEFGPATYRSPRGGAIVFSCSLLHEATDVVSGRRYALLGFFYNPDDGLDTARNR